MAGADSPRPRWIRDRATGAAFVLGLAILGGFAWASIRSEERLIIDADWRQHTYLVVAEIRGFLNALIDGQTGEQGYFLSGDKVLLARYLRAASEVNGRLDKLRLLTADNPRQQRQTTCELQD